MRAAQRAGRSYLAAPVAALPPAADRATPSGAPVRVADLAREWGMSPAELDEVLAACRLVAVAGYVVPAVVEAALRAKMQLEVQKR